MENYMNEIADAINEAQFILIGCGEALSIKNSMNSKEYEKKIFRPLNVYGIHTEEDFINVIEQEECRKWLKSILEKSFHMEYQVADNYNKIYKIIKDKSYFVITTNTDKLIYKSKLEESKIVAPCGNELMLQCVDGCEEIIWEGKGYIDNIMEKLDSIMISIQEKKWDEIDSLIPRCPNCNKKAIFNVRSEANSYIETGYLEQWKKYLDWLMKTLNKKILMIELGEGFDNPTVIRWAFEKNTFINNKAKLIRVNDKFWQVTEEIKEKAISVPVYPNELLRQINL